MYLNKRYRDKKNPFGPRVGFNHGFHDATHDKANGKPRELSDTTHSVTSVSPTFDVMYYEGYRAGLAQDDRPESSEPTWIAFRSTLTEAQIEEIYQAEILADMAGCAKQYREYRLRDATKHAAKVCGR
jgi:hypothetical protein